MLNPAMSTCGPPRKPNVDFCDYLLAELRCAALRARILQADLEAIGIALKHHMITTDQALGLLRDCDALRLVAPEAST